MSLIHESWENFAISVAPGLKNKSISKYARQAIFNPNGIGSIELINLQHIVAYNVFYYQSK